MRKYQVESILRHPVELYSAIYLPFFAFLFLYYPNYFFLQTSYSIPIVIFLLIISVKRIFQTIILFRYRGFLKKNKIWALALNTIKSHEHTFIARGFEWTVKHTARIAYCRSEIGREYVDKNKQDDSIGGLPLFHGVGMFEINSNQLVKLSDSSLQGNTIVVGTTGTGKSSTLKYWVAQDIHRGDCTIIIDPKTDSGVMDVVFEACVDSGRLDDLYILSLANPELSDSYNPTSRFEKVTEVANRLTGQMSGSGNNAAFKEFAWSYLNSIVGPIVEMGETPNYEILLSYSRDFSKLSIKYFQWYLPKHIDDYEKKLGAYKNSSDLKKGIQASLKEYPDELIAMVKVFKESDLRCHNAEGIIRLLETGKDYLSKTIQQVFPMLEKLCTGNISQILTDSSINGKVFDWDMVVKEKKVVYVALDSLTDAGVSGIIGSSMLADLTTLAGKIYNKILLDPQYPKHNVRIYGDELKEIAGPELMQLLNKGRGAGFYFAGFAQSIADLPETLGSQAAADVMLENFNNRYMFAVKNENTANYITSMLPSVSISSQTLISGHRDNSNVDSDEDFVSDSQLRTTLKDVPLISNADIQELPRGHCFASLATGKIMKLQVPLIKIDRKKTPEKFSDKVSLMRRAYKRAGH